MSENAKRTFHRPVSDEPGSFVRLKKDYDRLATAHGQLSAVITVLLEDAEKKTQGRRCQNPLEHHRLVEVAFNLCTEVSCAMGAMAGFILLAAGTEELSGMGFDRDGIQEILVSAKKLHARFQKTKEGTP